MTKKYTMGFSLIELMMVVAITGVLASVAIPMYARYIKKTKTSEAYTILRKIFDGEISYYTEDHTSTGGTVVSKQFIATNITPDWPPQVAKRMGDFTGKWDVIHVSVDSPTQYVYWADAYPFDNPYPFRPPEYDVTSDPPSDAILGMQVVAIGDIDGDGVYSLFSRGSHVPIGGSELNVEKGFFSIDELE